MRMAQIMKAHAREPIIIRELAPLLTGSIVVKWGTVPAADDGSITTPSIAQ